MGKYCPVVQQETVPKELVIRSFKLTVDDRCLVMPGSHFSVLKLSIRSESVSLRYELCFCFRAS